MKAWWARCTAAGVTGVLAGGAQGAERDRQIETPAFLGKIGGGEIDRDPPVGKLELVVDECAMHPVLALAHRHLGQTHDRHRRQSARELDLDRDRRRLDPEPSAAVKDTGRQDPLPNQSGR